MSNGTNTPFGLVPLRTLDGSDIAMSSGLVCTIASGYATNLIPGDLVTFSGTGSASGPGIVRLAAAGNPTIGVFGGLLQQIVTTSPGAILFQQAPSWVASTTSSSEIIAWVYTDPNIVYAIQTGATGIAATDLGNNANVVVASGSLTTNLSGFVLGTPAGDADLNCKIIGLASSLLYPGNAFGNTYNVAEVLLNNHIFKGGTGTAGI